MNDPYEINFNFIYKLTLNNNMNYNNLIFRYIIINLSYLNKKTNYN